MRGWVYVISNKAMPGLHKVGFSLKDPDLRARELEHTSVPHPFVVEYEVLVNEPRDLEQRIHESLSEFWERKEWFRCTVADAVEAIRRLLGETALLEDLRSVEQLHAAPVEPGCASIADAALAPSPAPIVTRPAATRREQIKFSARYTGRCQYCGHGFGVTVTRHEFGTNCPECHRYNNLVEFVSRELPR